MNLPNPDDLKDVGLKPVKYTTVKSKTKIEYAQVANDCFFQVHIPKQSLKFWMNHNNKALYKKLIDVVKKNNAGLKTDYAPPKKSFEMVTIAVREMALRPFFEHAMGKIARDLSKLELEVL